MPNLLEIAGRETLSQLDYIGSLNIQLWDTLRGMRARVVLSTSQSSVEMTSRARRAFSRAAFSE